MSIDHSTYGEFHAKRVNVNDLRVYNGSDTNYVNLQVDSASSNYSIKFPPEAQDNTTILTDGTDIDITLLDVNGGTSKASPVDADELILYDATGLSVKKTTVGAIKDSIAELPSSHNSGDLLLSNGTSFIANASSGDVLVDSTGEFTIQASAVEESMINDSAVATAKIADSAVSTAKIADDAVSADKLADDAVASANIQDDAVSNAKIADNAVATANVQDDAITSAKIADNACLDANINSLNGTSDGTVSASSLVKADVNSDLSGFNALGCATLTASSAVNGVELVIGTGANRWKFSLDSGNLALSVSTDSGSTYTAKHQFTS